MIGEEPRRCPLWRAWVFNARPPCRLAIRNINLQSRGVCGAVGVVKASNGLLNARPLLRAQRQDRALHRALPLRHVQPVERVFDAVHGGTVILAFSLAAVPMALGV